MNYFEFTELIGRRARFDTQEQLVRSLSATLQTLSECLPGHALARLIARLPREAGMYMRRNSGTPESYSIHEFFERVSERSGADKSLAVQRAWAVISAVEQQLSLAELNDLRKSLPRQYERLFEFAV